MTSNDERRQKAYLGNIVLPDQILARGVVVTLGQEIEFVSSQLSRTLENECEIFDAGRDFIAPGLIDLHLHGALGKDVMDGNVESLKTIAGYQSRCGVTGFLGATMSASSASVLAAVRAVREFSAQVLDSEILGVYIEGSFINVSRRGAHDPRYFGNFSEDREIRSLFENLSGLKVIMTVSPEIEAQMELIPELIKRGFIAAIGHSDASYSQALNSFDDGISHATHLFNAMSGFHHRKPGVVGAVLDAKGVTAELIADGVHVHPSAVRLALARKGTEGICLVTDSCLAAGFGDGFYGKTDSQIEINKGRAVLRGTDTLAGGVLPLISAVKNTVEWCGLSVFEGIKMATLNPARVLGLDDRLGSIKEGNLANLVVFDENFNVRRTILRGRQAGVNDKEDK
jgi:N-acetylglucosamine-6-phosphate deacetylase